MLRAAAPSSVTRSRRAAMLTTFCIALSGCADSDRSPREPAREVARDPEAAFRSQAGRQWSLVRMGTREFPPPPAGTPLDSPGRDLVPGRRPTISFTLEPARAGGRSFCNSWGGPYTLRGDSLRITEWMGTAVGCDGPDTPEESYFRALGATRRFELDSNLLSLIAVDGSRLVFEPSAASPPSP